MSKRDNSARRARNVPHTPVTRERNLVEETNTRCRERKTVAELRADLVAPSRPAILFLYDDLAQDEIGPEPVFGMYPSSFIPKILPWLKCDRRRVVHVCSGGLPRGEGIRVDVRPAARPDVLADGRHLPFRTGSVEAVLLDPPYTEHYAKDLYGVDYPRPSHLLREAARVVKPCGRIGFVHYITPIPPPLQGCEGLRTQRRVRLPDARLHHLRARPGGARARGDLIRPPGRARR